MEARCYRACGHRRRSRSQLDVDARHADVSPLPADVLVVDRFPSRSSLIYDRHRVMCTVRKTARRPLRPSPLLLGGDRLSQDRAQGSIWPQGSTAERTAAGDYIDGVRNRNRRCGLLSTIDQKLNMTSLVGFRLLSNCVPCLFKQGEVGQPQRPSGV